MFRSMTYVLTVINRFIDIALSQRLSQSEITLLINDELAEFDYQDEMWSVENPYTILDLALKEVDASSVVHELVSNKQNYYGLMRNLEFESKKKNQAAIRISTKIANSLVTRNSVYLFQLFGFSGRYTAKVDSIFQLILWNIAYNQQNLGRQTSNKLIQLVCHYYLAIVECESDSTSGCRRWEFILHYIR